MAYCRWSSDDYQCDVYCYESVYGGFITHVAERRHNIDLSKLPEKVDCREDWEKRYERFDKVSKMINEASDRDDFIEIGLPFDGQEFRDNTAKEAASTLKMLKETGYNVPQSAIDLLLSE